MENKKYVIYQNDLKNRKLTNIDISKVDWNQNDIRNIININHDTIEYRLNESNKDHNNSIDLTNLDYITIPQEILNNLFFNNLHYLFLSNNNIDGLLDLSSFKVLSTVDIDNNNITKIILPSLLVELSINNNKLTKIICNNELLRLKCSNNMIDDIVFNNNLEIFIGDNNKLREINISNLFKLKKIVIYNNPLYVISFPPNIEYIDISNTNITNINNIKRLDHLVANNCNKLITIPKFKYLEYLELIGSPVEKLYYYDNFKLIIVQMNLTKNISKKYKENDANIQIRNDILLTISKNCNITDYNS